MSLWKNINCVAGGQSCAAYDVIINNKFFQKLEAREVLMGFVLTLVLEGLEYKYGLNLSRGKNWFSETEKVLSHKTARAAIETSRKHVATFLQHFCDVAKELVRIHMDAMVMSAQPTSATATNSQ